MLKDFYDKHKNFSGRSIIEYFISPGIKCKFDILKENLNSNKVFLNGIDLGSSGNSILFFLDNVKTKSFLDITALPLKHYKTDLKHHPLCGDLIRLPYRNESFDFITALDVLEHIKNDKLAISEISRIIKISGVVVITVPHRMKYYTNQDKLIGHFRRYEIDEIINLFEKFNLKHLTTFGVYGLLMRISEIQSTNPEKLEKNIIDLRSRYENNEIFRKLWKILVSLLSKLMKIDAKYQPLRKVMNIALIFKKQ